jgi:transcriptional antiterminator RfaH
LPTTFGRSPVNSEGLMTGVFRLPSKHSLVNKTSSPDSNWYLIHTKARQESVALENLERQGYECFLPLILIEKIRRGKLQAVQEPLFPRYLFIRLSSSYDSLSWTPIRSTLGVSRLVSFGQIPAKVEDKLIEALSLQSNSSAVLQKYFQPGEEVVVNQGPFAGIKAIYQMDDGEGRVMVLLNILSQQVKMMIEPNAIRKIN